MNDQDFKAIYGITEAEKQQLIDRISQDVSWAQDDLIYNEEQEEEESQNETDL